MQKFYQYGFFTLLFFAVIFAFIIREKDNESKLEHLRMSNLEQRNLDYQNKIDNLLENIDTLQKTATKIEYRTKIKEGKRDSIFVTIDKTNYRDIDSCNHAVVKLVSVCKMDKEIFLAKDSIIAVKDSVILDYKIIAANYKDMSVNKDEINEHLNEDLQREKVRKKGAMVLFTAMAILNAYLMIKK